MCMTKGNQTFKSATHGIQTTKKQKKRKKETYKSPNRVGNNPQQRHAEMHHIQCVIL